MPVHGSCRAGEGDFVFGRSPRAALRAGECLAVELRAEGEAEVARLRLNSGGGRRGGGALRPASVRRDIARVEQVFHPKFQRIALVVGAQTDAGVHDRVCRLPILDQRPGIGELDSVPKSEVPLAVGGVGLIAPKSADAFQHLANLMLVIGAQVERPFRQSGEARVRERKRQGMRDDAQRGRDIRRPVPVVGKPPRWDSRYSGRRYRRR